eukprot:6175124-Pleurochrysis_carterae.AAC.2
MCCVRACARVRVYVCERESALRASSRTPRRAPASQPPTRTSQRTTSHRAPRSPLQPPARSDARFTTSVTQMLQDARAVMEHTRRKHEAAASERLKTDAIHEKMGVAEDRGQSPASIMCVGDLRTNASARRTQLRARELSCVKNSFSSKVARANASF